jgi:hypothetical protein
LSVIRGAVLGALIFGSVGWVAFEEYSIMTHHHHRAPPPAAKGVHEPCQTPHSNKTATELIATAELGWNVPAPQWVVDLCPEVMNHLEMFPYFKNTPILNNVYLPVSTTDHAARGLCTLKAVQLLAANMSMPVHLSFGSHLGAARHGQPIPWDDDIDVAMPRGVSLRTGWKSFLQTCDGLRIHPTAELRCKPVYKCIKVYVEYEDMKNDGEVEVEHHRQGATWRSPFVDVFFYDDAVPENKIMVRTLYGKQLPEFPDWRRDIYFPLEEVYFGGLRILAPQPASASQRYSFTECILAGYNHRYEHQFEWKGILDSLELSCCRLAQVFPFLYANGTISNGQHQVRVPQIF